MKHRNALSALCGAALMALLLAGCSQTAPDTREADAKAIKDLESRWTSRSLRYNFSSRAKSQSPWSRLVRQGYRRLRVIAGALRGERGRGVLL